MNIGGSSVDVTTDRPTSTTYKTIESPANEVGFLDDGKAYPIQTHVPARQSILGVPIDFVACDNALKEIECWRQNKRRGYICVVNPWSITLSFRDVEMHEALIKSSLSIPDGIGITLAAKVLGFRHNGRVKGPDFMFNICELGRRYGYRHFLYGGAEGVTANLAKRLCNTLPGLQVVGTYCPPFRQLTKDEIKVVIDRVNSKEPDIVWVGLGAPKQEKWMLRYRHHIKATALVGVGAAFDFLSGNITRAPSWVQRIGCEWVWRLSHEPRRLWHKNILSPLFMMAVLAQRCGMWRKQHSIAREVFKKAALILRADD